MLMKFLRPATFISFCILMLPLSLNAQDNEATLFSEEEAFPKVLELNWLNEQFLIKQRKRVDKLTRAEFGTALQTGERNIPILQRIVDAGVIENDDKELLQALGVILGDAFVSRHRELEWKVYHDELGKSHAVCILKTKHCLFPITMLSRRMEVGLKPNVRGLYDENFGLLKDHLTRLPFQD